MPTEWDDFAPRRLSAIELRGECGGGRSRPLRVQCRAPDGSLVNTIVKLTDPMVPDGTPWRLCLARELAAAIFARCLGLSVPDYAIVEFSDAFIASVANTRVAERVRNSRGPNFGSVVVNNVLEDIPKLPASWEPAITFDALAFNADRMTPNPNVLWNGLDLYLIDHGMVAPTWTRAVDGLTDTTLFGEVNIRLHAGFQVLRGTSVSYTGVSNGWVSLVRKRLLDWVRTQIPPSWAAPSDISELCCFLDTRATIMSQQVDELRRVIP